MQRIKKKIFFIVYTVFFIFLHCIAFGHGFAPDTQVLLSNGSLYPIHSICLHALHNAVSVVSYDIDASSNANQQVKSGRRSKANCYIRLGFDAGFNDVAQNDVVCTPMQEFYLPVMHCWVPAYMLKKGDALLTKNMTTKSITYIQFVPKSLKIYTLEIEKSHTFFVGKYSVLTHNMILPIAASLGFTVPFGSVATGTAGSFFGPIGMIGGIVFGGVVSIAIKTFYESRILRYKTPVYNIASIKTHCYNSARYDEGITSTKKPTGCFVPDDEYNKIRMYITPIENPLPKTAIGCIDIEIAPVSKENKGCFQLEELEPKKVTGCFEPVDLGGGILCYDQEKVPAKDNPKIRYDGPKARNWGEFERDCPVGQQHGTKFINTGKQNPKDGSPLRKLSEDIPNTEMFKEGRFFALDRFHEGDHMEVWDKNRHWIGVANLDGSKNYVKSNAEINPVNRRLPR